MRYIPLIIALIVIPLSAMAETLERPSNTQILVWHALKETDNPDFEAIVDNDYTLRRLNEFERQRKRTENIEELVKIAEDLKQYDSFTINAGDKMGPYNFEGHFFINKTFEDSVYFPYNDPKFGSVRVVFDNADEFLHVPVDAEKAEAFLNTTDNTRKVSMVIDVTPIKAERNGRTGILHTHVNKVSLTYPDNPYSSRANKLPLTELVSKSEPTVAAAIVYDSSETLDASDIDYRGLTLGMTASQVIEWAKANGAQGRISRSLHEYGLPEEKPTGMFGSKKWKHMDSNIERMKIGEFDWDRHSCKGSSTLCLDAHFDKDGKMTKVKFRDVYAKTNHDELLAKLKGKFGAPSFEVEDRAATGGDMFQQNIPYIQSNYMGFGRSVNGVKPMYKVFKDIRHVLTLRVGAAYSTTYIEGELNDLTNVKENGAGKKPKKDLNF